MRTEKFLCPSLIEAEIRESTGADDDILSSLDEPNVVLNRYISAILISLGGVAPVTPQMVKDLKIRDKYFILIKARIFSLGPDLYFTHNWGDGLQPEEYHFDLSGFVWDYTQPLPTFGEEGYFDQRILPYNFTQGDAIVKTLTTGRTVKMKFLDGHGEEILLKLPPSQRTINSQLSSRAMQVSDDNLGFVKVVNFGVFSSREMVEIRSAVEEFDPPVEGLLHLTHPASREVVPISLIQIRDFFFPVKV